MGSIPLLTEDVEQPEDPNPSFPETDRGILTVTPPPQGNVGAGSYSSIEETSYGFDDQPSLLPDPFLDPSSAYRWTPSYPNRNAMRPEGIPGYGDLDFSM